MATLDPVTRCYGSPKLSEIGISKIQSSRWQQMASIPESVFEEHIAETIGTEEELTSSSLLNIAHSLRIKQKEEERRRKISEATTLSEEESGIYCSDCVEFMKNMDDESVDLVVTSPPYDDIRLSFNSSSWSFSDVAKQLFRIIKEGGLVCWVVQMLQLRVPRPKRHLAKRFISKNWGLGIMILFSM